MNYEQAAELSECFLRNTLDLVRRVPALKRWIGYLPDGSGPFKAGNTSTFWTSAEEYFQQLAPDMELILQRGETLGERLDDLITRVLSGGEEQVIVLDSDSPNLPVEYILQAFDLLPETDVILGPPKMADIT